MRKIKRAILSILLVSLTVLFIVFAVANRGALVLSFFPLPYTLEMPTFLFALLVFSVGIVIGGFSLSVKLAKHKRFLKLERQRSKALENEVKALRMEQADRAPAALLP